MINKLKSRGLIFTNIENANKILKFENYYKLINGYKDIFLDPGSSTEKFKKGLHFSEVYSLYKFDEEIRSIFFKRILSIENQVKSVISYEFSISHNKDEYLSIQNYNLIYKNNSDLQRMIQTLKNIVTPNKYNKQSFDKRISHYNSQYGFVPLWVLINLITLGNASYFYKFMKPQEQNNVAKSFQIKPNILNNYLKILTIVRNICAHNKRLFSLKFRSQIAATSYNQNFHNSQSHVNRNDLFSLLIVIKQLMNDSIEFDKIKKRNKNEPYGTECFFD
jgi:abortive infection bacteriophage resistance protein